MNIAEFIDARFNAMIAHPEHWGDSEAFETQALLLLELRSFLQNPTQPDRSLFLQQELYSNFIRSRLPLVGPRPLSAAGYPTEVIASALDDFRSQLDALHAPSAIQITAQTPA